MSDLKNKNFTEIIDQINNTIREKNIYATVFDVDYFKFINFFFIDKIKCKKKILITGDDFELHEINSITASACDIVLSHCPLSVLKYKEKGYEAHHIHFDNGEIGKRNAEKVIDVLFFGNVTPDRKEFLNYITNSGINLKNVGYENKTHGIPEDDLMKLISQSKIVLNLSKSRTTSVKSYSSENVFKYYYQFKGRILISGLNGAACVSEYSPGQELIFAEEELPTFYSKEECVKLLKTLLNDNELLKKYTERFTSKVCNFYEDKKTFDKINSSISKEKNRRVELIKIPYWYLRIAAKTILLRNIKLINLFKSIIQLRIIYSIMENSNAFTKLLITIESILNIFWYSIIFTFKNKK